MQPVHDSCTRRFRFRGLRVVYERVEGPITAVALTIRAGARFDGERAGLAHMAEHMLFQGTHELDQLALNRRAAEVGSGHNASTGYESIALTIEAFNEDVEGAIGLLADQFYESRIEPSRFRKERRIILDEIRSVEDDPLEYLNQRSWEAFFGAPIGHPICGTRASLREMQPEDVARFLKRRFVNANAVLAVVGGVGEKRLREALKKCIRRDRVGRSSHSRAVARGRHGALRIRGGPSGQAFATRFLEVDPRPANLLALGIALDVVGADPDAGLFQAVRERHGLGYDVAADLDWGEGWAAAVLSGSARPGQEGRVARVIDDVLEESARDGFSAADLARARRKRRFRYAALLERRLDRALAHAECVVTGFPSLEESERIVGRLDDGAIQRAWRRAVLGRSLRAVLRG
jgi:predicted Zn-dependent peptidase